MAEKRTKLEIVIGAIDKASAVVRSIQRRINAIAVLSAPISLIGERLGGLAKAAGLPKLVEGFKGVGGAVTGVLGRVKAIGGILGGLGLGVTAAVAGLVKLIGHFDSLGDLSARIGFGVDAIARLRYAADNSGVSVDQINNGLATFNTNLGKARAGTGALEKFLGRVSPALLRQVKAAKSNEQALDLLANAMVKLKDPAKRAALATATVGDAALAPLLMRGAKGIKDLGDEYIDLAGSQEGAVEAAGKAELAQKKLRASLDGVKAAIVVGLAPAFGDVINKLSAWIRENRAGIATWAKDLGTRIPGAVTSAINAFRKIVGFVRPFVDEGWKLKAALGVVAAVIAGPLIAAVVNLGIAIAATPVGWILAGLVAIAAAGYLLVTRWKSIKAFFVDIWDTLGEKFGIARDIVAFTLAPFIYVPAKIIANWKSIKGFFVDLWDGITSAFRAAWDVIKAITDGVVSAVETVTGAIDAINPFGGNGTPLVDYTPGSGGVLDILNQAQARGTQATEARVIVDFANAPKGTRVQTDPQSTASVDLSVGYQMGMAP